MKRLFLVLLLPAALTRAQTAVVGGAAREVPRLIMPGAPMGQNSAPGLLISPTAPPLIVPSAPTIIIPDAPVLQAPAPVIIPAARPMTEEEAAPGKPPSQADLKKLADSLSPAATKDAEDQDGARARSLDSRFDGKLAPEASAWDDVSERFARGPLSPELPVVATTGRSLIARLLPSFYRRVPVRVAYDKSERPATGHLWTPEHGHLIEFNPIHPNSDGNVPNAFGSGKTVVSQKIGRLMEFAHEYFHVLFDSAVGRKENHAPHSVYSAMTEGFAVTGEQLLVDRMLDRFPALGLGPRDASDLNAVARERSAWLDVEDNHYSEGILSWRDAYAKGGARGVLTFLSALSARRMTETPRSDPAYQLALGDHALLGAYMGRETDAPARRGLDAFAKAARGEKLTDAETRDAAGAVEKAGPEGWRRLFDRTLLADKRLREPKAEAAGDKWWDKKPEPAVSVEPVFALARLSPAAGAALSRYLAATISASGGAARLFERPGPNDKTNAIISGAEALPWSPSDRRLWDAALTRWLLGA